MDEANVQIFSNDISKSESLEFEPLLNKYKFVKYIEWSIFYIFILGLAITLYYFEDNLEKEIVYIFTPIFIIALLATFFIIHKSFPYKGYAIREKDIHYKSGLFTKTIISVPINRIQHLKVHQSIIGKLYNVASLKIFTAGDSSSDLVIKGISFEKAKKIKSLLADTIHTESE